MVNASKKITFCALVIVQDEKVVKDWLVAPIAKI